LVVLSTFFLNLVSLETYCGVERAKELPLIRVRKLVRVPHGYPPGSELQRLDLGEPRKPVILCVARIARMKGQNVLLTAFSTLATRFPEWTVKLVGSVEDSLFMKELVELATRYSLQDRIVFTKYVNKHDLLLEYSQASVFCLPSVSTESWGAVKCEATVNGLPVVTTDVPCARDAIEAGWLVARAGDAEDLAAKLEILMRDEGERLRVSNVAQSRERSWEDTIMIYLNAKG
jgi:glycosyltransferase involved in cell wall biosynthesis